MGSQNLRILYPRSDIVRERSPRETILFLRPFLVHSSRSKILCMCIASCQFSQEWHPVDNTGSYIL